MNLIRSRSFGLVCAIGCVFVLYNGYAAEPADSPARVVETSGGSQGKARPDEASKRDADAKVPEAIVQRPQASEFLLIPLRVYRLKSEKLRVADTSLTDRDVMRIVGKVNDVWAPAGIRFVLDGIVEEAADAEHLLLLPGLRPEQPADTKPGDAKNPAETTIRGLAAKEENQETVEPRTSRLFRALIPSHTRKFDGFRVYYIHDFDVNGIYYGNREAMVKETAALRQVPGGIDEPLPRVTAHELGHGLGLPHRQDRTNLMQSGTTGTGLSAEEISTARATAEKTPGMIRYAEFDAALSKAADDQTRKRIEGWRTEFDKDLEKRKKN
ncbi:MAG: hypothetical protein QM811_29155 [Pirellulales bacterium]